MDQTGLLIEYLKEQYTQARQHENRQTTSTSFLTGAAGIVLGFAVKDGMPKPHAWWLGIVLVLIGAANLWINRQHFIGNRFHTALAGETRRAIESAIEPWTVDRPTFLRNTVLKNHNLKGPDASIGKSIHGALRVVPIGVILIGIAIGAIALTGGPEAGGGGH